MIYRIACLILLFGSVAAAQSANPNDALRHMLDAQTAAWNRGDLEGFMKGYWKSPELTFFSGDTIYKGWEATLERYRQRYKAPGKEMGQLSFTDETIERLGPDGAVVSARWHLVFSNGEKKEGLTTVVCKRFANGWFIIHDHSS
jgi:beta-aspartyl-peptidase (threonine type)